MAHKLSADLVAFKPIILNLVSYASHPKLDSLLAKLTPKLANSKRFLIKMEIKRLAKPCVLVMDFRPFFHQHCEPVKHENICHYLDEISKALFFSSLEKNNGSFNLHIYNELTAKARERHKAIDSTTNSAIHMNNITNDIEIALEEVQAVSLVNDNFFDEPQLSAESGCRLFNNDPIAMSINDKLAIGIEVTALDINANSSIIKTPCRAANDSDDPVYLWFYDHDSALEFTDEIVLVYSIKDHKITRSGKHSHYLLKLSQASDNKMLSLFNELLAKRTQLSNQSKDNQVEPLIASINAKCHEQFLLSTTQDIPMLCAKYQTGWRPSMSLQTPSNLPLWEYFSDKNGNDPLARLFSHQGIQDAINTNSSFDQYAYLLKHQYQPMHNVKDENEQGQESTNQSQTQFIIIWQNQLKTDYAARKLLAKFFFQGNYRYIRLRVLSVNSHEDAHVPSALPDYISPTMALLNREPNKKAVSLLKASNQLAVVTDVTEINDVLALAETLPPKINIDINNDTKSNINDESPTAPLTIPKQFALAKLPRKSPMKIVSIVENDLRNEDRFTYKLDLVLTHAGKETVNIKGHSINVSTRGMLIELATPIVLKVGIPLKLTINMPYRDKVIAMPNQGYKLLSCKEQRFLGVEINGHESKHAAGQVLREFIYQNMDELPYCGFEQNSIYGLPKAMRNIYAKNHLSIPFFINQDKSQWHISSIAMNQNTHIENFDDNDNDVRFMLLKMVEQQKFRKYCLSLLNKVSLTNPTEVFYILTIPKLSATNNELSFWFSDIKQLQKSGKLSDVLGKVRSIKQPCILRVQLSKPNKVMDKYFRDELNYLEKISSTSAEKLTTAMSLLAGIGEITDHTEQVLQLFDNFISKQDLADAG